MWLVFRGYGVTRKSTKVRGAKERMLLSVIGRELFECRLERIVSPFQGFCYFGFDRGFATLTHGYYLPPLSGLIRGDLFTVGADSGRSVPSRG